MKSQFKILALILITSAMSYGQRHQILKKSVDVDKNASVILNFENIYVAIEESTDGKIHVDYLMEFEGFSKKEIQKKLDQVTAEVTNFDNNITLNVKSEQQISFANYTLKGDYGLQVNGEFGGLKNDSIIRKSKDSLLKEIIENNKTRFTKNSLKYINGKFKKIDKDGNLSDLEFDNIDIMRSQCVVQVPPYVKLNINGRNAGIHFRTNAQNEISVVMKQGTLKTKELMNKYNSVRIDNANFEAEAILGGNYNFKHVRNGKIGSMVNSKIESEFSKVEIGEIGKNTTITDFNSEYWFYNWSEFFDRFNLYSEYSKIHFFYPKLNFDLKVVGNNTKSFLGDKTIISMQPTRKNEKFTMMTREPYSGGDVSGRIFFDIIHGIIYSYDYTLTMVRGEEVKNKNR